MTGSECRVAIVIREGPAMRCIAQRPGHGTDGMLAWPGPSGKFKFNLRDREERDV